MRSTSNGGSKGAEQPFTAACRHGRIASVANIEPLSPQVSLLQPQSAQAILRP